MLVDEMGKSKPTGFVASLLGGNICEIYIEAKNMKDYFCLKLKISYDVFYNKYYKFKASTFSEIVKDLLKVLKGTRPRRVYYKDNSYKNDAVLINAYEICVELILALIRNDVTEIPTSEEEIFNKWC